MMCVCVCVCIFVLLECEANEPAKFRSEVSLSHEIPFLPIVFAYLA